MLGQIERMSKAWESKSNYGSNKRARYNNNNKRDPPEGMNAIWESAVEKAKEQLHTKATEEEPKSKDPPQHSPSDSEFSSCSDNEEYHNEFRHLNIHEWNSKIEYSYVGEQLHTLNDIQKPKKKVYKLNNYIPMLIGLLNIHLGKEKNKPIQILCDSGTTAMIILGKHTTKLRNKKDKRTTWITKAGTFTTSEKCRVQVQLPEFDDNKVIEYKVHVDSSPKAITSQYDMIMGCDLMAELGLQLDFKERVMTWDSSTAPMKSHSMITSNPEFTEYLENLELSYQVQELYDRMDKILDADYHKADLNKVTEEAIHLTPEEQKQLNFLLKRYEHLFDGQLGKWKGKPIDIELKPGVQPYHAKNLFQFHSLWKLQLEKSVKDYVK